MQKKTLVPILILIAIIGAIAVVLSLLPRQAPTPTPKLAVDLYPLYGGVSWGKTIVAVSDLPSGSATGTQVTSVPVTGTMDPGSVFTPFTQYYDRLLKSRGWTEDSMLAAGGHVGGQTAYRNGPGLILVGFHIVYHTVPKDAPSECPCDVTVSLFSSGVQD